MNLENMSKSKASWRTLWLGVSSVIVPVILGLLNGIARPLLDPESMVGRKGFQFDMGGFAGMLVSFILIFFTYRGYRRSRKEGERSWAIWIGLAFATAIALFWIFMIAGELLFPH